MRLSGSHGLLGQHMGAVLGPCMRSTNVVFWSSASLAPDRLARLRGMATSTGMQFGMCATWNVDLDGLSRRCLPPRNATSEQTTAWCMDGPEQCLTIQCGTRLPAEVHGSRSRILQEMPSSCAALSFCDPEALRARQGPIGCSAPRKRTACSPGSYSSVGKRTADRGCQRRDREW